MTLGYDLVEVQLAVEQSAQVIELDVSHEIDVRVVAAIRLDPHLEGVDGKPEPDRVTSLNAQYVPSTCRHRKSAIIL